MNIEEIESFLQKKTSRENKFVRISFKNREAVFGMFVKEKDYSYLKSRNFWRIVTRMNMEAYDLSADPSLARLFSGTAFTKLALYKEDAL